MLKTAKKFVPLWHTPKEGDEIVVDGQLHVVKKLEEYKNGKGKITLETEDGKGRLWLKGTLPFSGWAHWKGIAAGPKSTYSRPRR